ncbi:MAG TPA: nucleotide sugar dehydrogenase [Candidatus Binatia bacterium]|nr:nucleotide sugar dehydrogenase [Candidatus Binatia bacterium]
MKTIQRVTIVGGCGHVGLPLGIVLASKAGLQVDLLDIDPKKVEQVNSGTMPFMERGADELLREVAGRSLTATLNAACINEADAVITVVGTPVDRHLNPTVGEVYRSIDALLDRMQDGTLLVLRSTVYPGVTRLVYERLRKLKRNVLLAFCPERIAEGNAIEELIRLPQIVSGFEPEAIAAARRLFGTIAPSLIELTPPEAEVAKLFTNAWRYANFAISNQFYMLAQSRGLDFYRIHDAVTRDYPRMRSFARAGFAAGPCLLKDTLQLAAYSQNNFFLGHAAMLINEGLPMFLVEQLRPCDLANKRVAILGMAFKAESDDSRDSLSYKLKKLLEVEALEVLCTDPYVADSSLVPLETALRKADIVIVGAPHAVYRELEIPEGKVVLDPWNFFPVRAMASTTA